jgi:hypothetical protein
MVANALPCILKLEISIATIHGRALSLVAYATIAPLFTQKISQYPLYTIN